MRKALLASAVALIMAGCATQHDGSPAVQVRDLTMSREQTPASSYTVESGDTLYGIAWRHDMDYRTLAQLNDIGPPYRLQPGQELRLSAGGQVATAAASGQSSTGQLGAVDLTAEQGTAEEVELDWLAPDTEVIERNRRLTAQPLEASEVASSTSSTALAGAAVAGNTQGAEEGPGPLFDHSTPGADGNLSARDLAEREALQRELAAQETAAREAAAQEEAAQQSASSPEPTDTQPSSIPDDTQVAESEPTADAGTAVAGQDTPSTSERSQRSFVPADEIAWQWPSDGELQGAFGDSGSITAGIDIGGQKGQPVRAAGSGIVVYAGSGVRGYGKLILLKHNDEYLSAYAHNDSLNVTENDVVEAGEVIAAMGDTDADSVKLHFEVRRNGQPQDPLEFLPAR